MKKSILFFAIVSIFAMGCNSDPCDDAANIDCATGDADGDGIINSLDSAPEDACLPEDNLACATGDLDNDGVANAEDVDPLDRCVPNVPSFDQVVIGNWAWSTFGGSGSLEILEDGTYVENSGDILSNGNVVERTWTVENNNKLALSVKNDLGLSAGLNLNMKSFDCDKITFEGFLGDLIFTKQ